MSAFACAVTFTGSQRALVWCGGYLRKFAQMCHRFLAQFGISVLSATPTPTSQKLERVTRARAATQYTRALTPARACAQPRLKTECRRVRGSVSKRDFFPPAVARPLSPPVLLGRGHRYDDLRVDASYLFFSQDVEGSFNVSDDSDGHENSHAFSQFRVHASKCSDEWLTFRDSFSMSIFQCAKFIRIIG